MLDKLIIKIGTFSVTKQNWILIYSTVTKRKELLNVFSVNGSFDKLIIFYVIEIITSNTQYYDYLTYNRAAVTPSFYTWLASASLN